MHASFGNKTIFVTTFYTYILIGLQSELRLWSIEVTGRIQKCMLRDNQTQMESGLKGVEDQVSTSMQEVIQLNIPPSRYSPPARGGEDFL